MTIGRPFQQGISGNPGGRPRNMARLSREATDNGVDFFAFFVSVFHGKMPLVGDGVALQKRPITLDDRIEAARWLTDRGWGKAALNVTVEADEADLPLAKYSVEELLAMRNTFVMLTEAESSK